jgi:hypothetical protein
VLQLDVRDEIKSEQSRTDRERERQKERATVELKSGELGEEVSKENTTFVFIGDEVSYSKVHLLLIFFFFFFFFFPVLLQITCPPPPCRSSSTLLEMVGGLHM